ncbi:MULTISPECIES: hypothetical protein [Hyphobacterium]|uniref:Uncharacterized protein n=1 Tax=Hyphobacterium vulgare TaxID=1736751 RepID=A0ABV6ZU93_9PROT
MPQTDDPMPMTNAGHDRRVDHVERRMDRVESDLSHLTRSMEALGGQIGGLNDKLSSFMREFNQAARTDWKTLLSALGVLVTVGVAAIGGAAWIITTLETSREERTTGMIEAQAEMHAQSMAVIAGALETQAARRDQIDERIIENYRRADDDLARRLDRLESLHLGEPE